MGEWRVNQLALLETHEGEWRFYMAQMLVHLWGILESYLEH